MDCSSTQLPAKIPESSRRSCVWLKRPTTPGGSSKSQIKTRREPSILKFLPPNVHQEGLGFSVPVKPGPFASKNHKSVVLVACGAPTTLTHAIQRRAVLAVRTSGAFE